MSQTLPPPQMPPVPGGSPVRPLTAADLAAMPSDAVCYELHHGRLITLPPPGDLRGAIEGNLFFALKSQGEHRSHGKARCGDVGVVLGRNPDHVVGADALFVCNARLPIQRSPEGYLETMPDLVVEVRSKNDTLAELQRKAQDYLGAGVRVVWVVDPINRNVLEYRTNQPPRMFAETDILTIDDVIPGFALLVGDALRD